MLRTVSIPVDLPEERFFFLMAQCAEIFNAHTDWALEHKIWKAIAILSLLYKCSVERKMKMANTITTIHVYSQNAANYSVGLLLSDDEINKLNARLITVEEYEAEDKCVGSIFEALEPGELVKLQEGIFKLDEDLELINV